MWRDGAILLVAGRVDHRGEEASLLADAVWDWDEVADRGPEAFAREVGSLDERGGVGGPARRNGGCRQRRPAGGYGAGRGAAADPTAVRSPVGPGGRRRASRRGARRRRAGRR